MLIPLAIRVRLH